MAGAYGGGGLGDGGEGRGGREGGGAGDRDPPPGGRRRCSFGGLKRWRRGWDRRRRESRRGKLVAMGDGSGEDPVQMDRWSNKKKSFQWAPPELDQIITSFGDMFLEWASYK